MFAELTDYGGGTFGLPVVDTFASPKGVQVNGVNYPASIFRPEADGGRPDQELNDIGFARVSESVVSDNHDTTGFNDALTNGVVVRTYTVTLKPLDDLKARKVAAVLRHRSKIAAGGLTFSGKAIATDQQAMTEVGLIYSLLNNGGTFPGGSIPWPTMDGNVMTATETQFKAFTKDAAGHFVKATKAAQAHLDAIDALTVKQAVVDHDETADIAGSEWPVNPVI